MHQQQLQLYTQQKRINIGTRKKGKCTVCLEFEISICATLFQFFFFVVYLTESSIMNNELDGIGKDARGIICTHLSCH